MSIESNDTNTPEPEEELPELEEAEPLGEEEDDDEGWAEEPEPFGDEEDIED